jgi:hypothetical protein
MRVWNQKRVGQESLEPEEGKQGKCATEQISTGDFVQNNKNHMWEGDLRGR